MTIPKISALFETSLASAMTSSASSFTVVSGTDRDGNALSGTYGLIIDEGTSDEEFVVGSISSTTVTITYRGIDADAPNTEVSGNKKAHRRGASVKITDYPIMGVLRNILNGDETLPNKLQYASHPTISGNQDIPDKQYVDSLANTGAADATTTVQGLVEEATQAEVEAGTQVGGTGAKLFIPNDKNGAKLYFGYAADAGSNDTYAITLAPVPSAYTTGMVIIFKANTINTGACTINANTLGAKDIRRNNGLVLANGDIQALQFNTIVYNGTYFELQSPIGKPQVSQTGEEIYGASSGGSDTYAITVAPAPTAYTTGQVFRFKADVANTGTATLNVNSLGAKTIKKNVNANLETGDIIANQLVQVIYDGTNFQLNSRVSAGLVRLADYAAPADTAENTVYTTTVPGGLLGLRGGILIRTPIDFGNGATGGTVTLRLKYGGSTLSTIVITKNAVGGGSATYLRGTIDAWIINNAATNAQFVGFYGNVANQLPGTGTSQIGIEVSTQPADTTSAIDTTADQTLAMTAQKSTGSLDGNTTFFQTIVETKLN